MNKIKFLSIAAFIICVSISSLFAQRIEIAQKEYSAVRQNAYDAIKNVPRRIFSEKYVYQKESPKLQLFSKETNEVISAERQRFLTETKVFDLETEYSAEIILFDEFHYQRKNGGKWTKTKGSIPQSKVLKLPVGEAKYFLTKDVRFENRTADLLEMEQEITLQSVAVRTGEVTEIPVRQTTKYWIDEQGLILKSEFFRKSAETGNPIWRQIWIYEYDPNIKVEAPIK